MTREERIVEIRTKVALCRCDCCKDRIDLLAAYDEQKERIAALERGLTDAIRDFERIATGVIAPERAASMSAQQYSEVLARVTQEKSHGPNS